MEQGNKLEQYSAIETKIRSVGDELEGKVYDITTGKGLTAAKADRAIWRKLRTGVESIRKETKADVLALGRAIDGEAKRLTEIIVDGGQHVEEVVKAEEDRKAGEKAERERMERKRIEDIHDRIDDFKFTLSEYHPVDDLQSRFDELQEMEVDESFGEFQERAGNALAAAKGECHQALESAIDRAAQAEKDAAEQAQRARQLKAQAAAQAEDDERLAKERREFEEEKKERDKIDLENAETERQKKLDLMHKAALKEAKYESQGEALSRIIGFCDSDLSPAGKVEAIRLIAEAFGVGS
jgi:hypothetical protein